MNIKNNTSALDAFKEQYIDQYFPDVENYKKSLIENAPTELKQWLQDIREKRNPRPFLVYGACGVGKTMTAQALVQEANCSLCYISMPALMRFDWSCNKFEQKFLNELKGNYCVVIDNITQLASDDIENMHSLVDVCNSKKNLYLLAIAYHAKNNMPSSLYNKFQVVKFPLPNASTRLHLLKLYLQDIETAQDIDEKFLNNFNKELHNFAARDLEALISFAETEYCIEHLKDEELSIVLKKNHFEKAKKEYDKTCQMFEIKFDQCE